STELAPISTAPDVSRFDAPGAVADWREFRAGPVIGRSAAPAGRWPLHKRFRALGPVVVAMGWAGPSGYLGSQARRAAGISRPLLAHRHLRHRRSHRRIVSATRQASSALRPRAFAAHRFQRSWCG